MNGVRYGRVVYPRSFAERVPIPASWDERPLPQLLRGQHTHPLKEIERIERWYKELRGRKKGLRGRLRGINPRDFWAGLYELMTSRILVEKGWAYRYEPHLAGKTPDFSVRCPKGFSFVAEVLTAFQDPEAEKAEAAIYRVASCLNQLQHPFEVLLEEVVLPQQTVSLKPVVPRVRDWLDRCRPRRSQKITLNMPGVPIVLKLRTFQNPRPTPGPIVRAVMGIGGKITSTDRIKRAIQRKIERYESLRVPFVLLLWQGDWLKVTDTSLEWALFGRLQVHLRPSDLSKPAIWSHAPGGLFAFGKGGLPLNTSLSAVVFCSRVAHLGRVYARIQVYHHPYAARPLPLNLFKGVPQMVPFDVRPEGFVCRWDRRHRSRGILLH